MRCGTGWPRSSQSMMRTLVLPLCCRCRRPAYCCSVPFQDTGIASSRVSSGGWSNPSPTSRPVASTMRGASGGSCSSAARVALRWRALRRPCSRNRFGTCSASAPAIAVMWSVRSLSSSSFRHSSQAARASATMHAVRGWSSASRRISSWIGRSAGSAGS